MTPRERWLTSGLVLTGFGLIALTIWNQARYGDLREAVNRYVALDERQEKETPENAAFLRQARPEIRRSLARGEFEAALKRLKSLEEEDAASGAGGRGKAIPIAQLWPPKSPERKELQATLQELVRKQSEGYDVAPAQQKLEEVAEAARAGKRAEALAAFEQATALVQGAVLRPGFKPKVTGAAGPGGAVPTAAEQQAMDQAMGRLRSFRDAFPQLMAQPGVTDRQKQVLGQARVLFDEMIAAYDAKRDLRPVLKLLDPLKKAFDRAGKTQEWTPVEKLIEEARQGVKAAPPLPALAGTPPPNPPTPNAQHPTPPPPVLPPATVPGQPAPPNAGGIVRFLDMIRALPEEKYQAEKPKIGAGILQMLAARPAPPAGDAVGGDLQLLLGPQGELQGLRLFGELLAGQAPGGLTVQLGDGPELPIRAPVSRQGDTRRFRVESPTGAASVIVKPGPGELTLKIAGRRAQAGPPAFLNLTLPAQLGGWTWQPGPDAQTLAVDRDYRLQPVTGKLPALTLRGAAADLTLEAPTAAELTYHRGQLRLRLPLTTEAGVAEHTLRLTGTGRKVDPVP